MAGMDELRKIKVHEPIFLSFLADLIIPDTESSKIYTQQRKITSQLVQNGLDDKFITEEYNIVKIL
jgi:hypothetical protein